MNITTTNVLTILVSGFTALSAVACGGMDQAVSSEEAEAMQLEGDSVEFDSVEAELNNSDACKFAATDANYNKGLTQMVSGGPLPKLADGGYEGGRNGCAGARFFDINDMRTNGAAGTFRNEYMSGVAAANCTNRRLMVYAWDKNGTEFKSLNKWGVITVQQNGQAYCSLQTNITELGLTPNDVKDYHFAVSHREYSADGSTWTTLPIYGYGIVQIIA